ncbi:MAG: 16S rRNA (cytosine(967)-C(5))-methyltransferase RsmB [Gemmataceae bacterium]
MSPPLRFQGSRHNARSLALQVLLESERHEGFVQEILDRQLLSGVELSPADRRLATHLVYGVHRRRGTLMALLQPLVTRPADQVESWLWDTLCLGAYQLALLTQIPVHAALNETVELANACGRPGARGFINGVLRSLSRRITPQIRAEPGADALPLEGGTYRVLTQATFPDPSRDPGGYLAQAFGFPEWLARRWMKRMGQDEAFRMGFWFAGPAPLTLRVQPLLCSREAMLDRLREAGISASPGEHPQAIRLRDHMPIPELPGYAEGWFSVQDESAMRVGSALHPAPGSRVLDVCAAPGGKTCHLAELMGNRGEIIACDIREDRLATVTSLARRLHLDVIQTRRVEAENPQSLPGGPFDAILVDVPCSNTGVLGRRPEARWRLRQEEMRHLTRVQERLLRAALDRLAPGGKLVYSTCSIEPEENGLMVRGVLAGQPSLFLEAEEEASPGRPADGGYWARLRRSDPKSAAGKTSRGAREA